jgi:hypothetical protein
LLSDVEDGVDQIACEPLGAEAFVRRRNQKRMCSIDIAFGVFLADSAQEMLQLSVRRELALTDEQIERVGDAVVEALRT